MNTTIIKISELRELDAARNLDTPEAVAEYLNAAIEDGDMKFFAHWVGVAARAVGMSRIAEDTGSGARRSMRFSTAVARHGAIV